MLTNWKHDALYLQDKIYDFDDLPSGVAVPSESVLDAAIEAGYMEVARNSDPIAEPNIVQPLIKDTVAPPAVSVAKGKQPKET